MDPLWLLLLLPVAAASGWVTAKRERRPQRPLPEAYFKGLSFLLNEQPDKALQVFMDAVEMDGETVELHLALGNLFRRRGEIERATRIHHNLATRAGLDAELRAQALFELAQDYFKAGLFDRAENLFHELREAPEHREPACRFLLQIYDQEKEWRDAIAVAEELARISGDDLSESLAQYCCELAERAIADGKHARAERHLESAFRYDPHCARAVIQSGRLASMRGNHANAIAIWRNLEHLAPHALGEVVDHLANSYAALGDHAEYKKFLLDAVDRNPDSRLLAALIEAVKHEQAAVDAPHTDATGRDRAGQKLLLDLVRRRPSLEGLCALLKSRAASGAVASERERKDFTVIADLLSQVVGQGAAYHCHTCGFHASALHWQCPGCKNWGTVQKQPARRALAVEADQNTVAAGVAGVATIAAGVAGGNFAGVAAETVTGVTIAEAAAEVTVAALQSRETPPHRAHRLRVVRRVVERLRRQAVEAVIAAAVHAQRPHARVDERDGRQESRALQAAEIEVVGARVGGRNHGHAGVEQAAQQARQQHRVGDVGNREFVQAQYTVAAGPLGGDDG